MVGFSGRKLGRIGDAPRSGSARPHDSRWELDPAKVIRDAERLVDIFGGWPSFHDSEVLAVHLERRGQGDFDGPVLQIRFHLFRGRRDPSSHTGVAWFDHTQATLEFSNVCELEIAAFNTQNAIADLRIDEAGRHPAAPGLPAYRVVLEPGFGVACSFLCGAIEVTGIQSGAPPGSVYVD